MRLSRAGGGYLAVALALVACGGGRVLPATVLGHFDRAPGALYDDALAHASASGYQVVESDRAAGRFTISARRTRRPAAFEVQCWQRGWIRITPAGVGVFPDRGGYEAPPDVAAEMTAFAIELHAALGSAPEAP